MVLRETMGVERNGQTADQRGDRPRECASADEQFRGLTAHLLRLATEDRLRLVSRAAIEEMWLGQGPVFRLRCQEDIRRFQRAARTLATIVGLGQERAGIFGAGAAELATNAVKHGGGGYGVLDSSPEWCRLRVSDYGNGIPLSSLLPAVLRHTVALEMQPRGGFASLALAQNQVYLATDTRGTMVILEAPAEPWLRHGGMDAQGGA